MEAAIEALRKEEYRTRDIALAGAFVTLSADGSVRIERGFVRAGAATLLQFDNDVFTRLCVDSEQIDGTDSRAILPTNELELRADLGANYFEVVF